MYQISYFLQHQRNQQFAVSRVSNGSFHLPHPFLNSIWGLRIQISVKRLPALGGWWCMVSPICIQIAACSTRLGEKIWTAARVDWEKLKCDKYSILLVKSQEASSHFHGEKIYCGPTAAKLPERETRSRHPYNCFTTSTFFLIDFSPVCINNLLQEQLLILSHNESHNTKKTLLFWRLSIFNFTVSSPNDYHPLSYILKCEIDQWMLFIFCINTVPFLRMDLSSSWMK